MLRGDGRGGRSVEERGQRAVLGDNEYFQTDAHWRDCVPFYEYFDGDNGSGVGASHQTGWTAIVAALLQYGAALRFADVMEEGIDGEALRPVNA